MQLALMLENPRRAHRRALAPEYSRLHREHFLLINQSLHPGAPHHRLTPFPPVVVHYQRRGPRKQHQLANQTRKQYQRQRQYHHVTSMQNGIWQLEINTYVLVD